MMVAVVLWATLSATGMADAEPAPTAVQLDAIWADFILLDDDGTKKAHEGVKALIRVPQVALPFLKQRVKPAPHPDGKRIQLLIADLDSPNFRTRDAATRELEKLGPHAVPALEKKLTEKLGLEMRRRLEQLLERAEATVLTPQELRTVRAIEVLQGIGSAEAIAFLQELAKGGDGAVETMHAKQALALLGTATK